MNSSRQLAIDIKGLTKVYGPLAAVSELRLEVERGEIVGLIGPNGSGKSTTLKMLVGLVRPTSGTARVLGLDIVRDSVAIRRVLGYMPEEVHPYRNMTGARFLAFCQSFHETGSLDRAMALAGRLDLPLDRKVRGFSLGMRVKLGLIQAIAPDPEVLILDEPTKGLDPTSRREVLDLILEEHARGKTVVISSHVLGEIERMDTRSEFIREGRIVSAEERARALARLDRVMTVAFEGDLDLDRLRRLPGVSSVARRGSTFRIGLGPDGRDALRAVSDLPVRWLEFRAPGLEDLYAELYFADGPASSRRGTAEGAEA